MNSKGYRHIAGALSLTILMGIPLAHAQTAQKAPAKQMHHEMMEKQQAQGQGMQGNMPAKCKAMMEKRQQMMQKCKAMDAKLDQLAAAMNTATGQKKIEAMAALLNELVQQRKAMHQMMMKMKGMGMHGGMMGAMSKSGQHPHKTMMKKMMQKQATPASPAGSGK